VLRISVIALSGLLLSAPALAWGDREQGALTAFAGATLIRSTSIHARPVITAPVVVYQTVPLHNRHWHGHRSRVRGPTVTWVAPPPSVVWAYPAPAYRVEPAAPEDLSLPAGAPPVGCTDIPVRDAEGRLLEYRRDCSAR
jgi:hypothetical protein